eukprot:PhM_4_TR4948/c0_g1_i1/m.30959/K00461/ALOX5; arachidonate 5-lipoxygenase
MGNIVSEECACIDRMPTAEGVITKEPQPHPTRCCLPQFDPFREKRLIDVHESTHVYPLLKERQISKSQDIDRDRSQTNMDENFIWKVRSNGLPFEFNLAPWEQLLPHVRTARGYDFQVEEVIREFMGTAGEAILRMGDGHPKKKLNTFADINMFFKQPGQPGRGFPKPERMFTHWMSDDEFARYRMSGPHSLHLNVVTRKTQIPTSFELKDDMVLGLMEQFDTVEEAMKASRIFIVDYSEILFFEQDDMLTLQMDEEALREKMSQPKLERSSNEYLCNPLALFYRTNSGQLRPLAIQLFAKTSVKFLEANPINPVFTPCDSLYAWNLAKMYFNCADMHVHLIISLCTYVYFLSAIIQLFLNRNLSLHHPLHQLIQPHVKLSLATMDLVIHTLIQKNGPFCNFLALDSPSIKDLMSRMWRKFDFNNKAFIHDYLERNPTEPLRGNAYLEDGKVWWDYIKGYVLHVLGSYYQSPDDIDDDEELKGWVHEMAANIQRVMELHPARREEPIAFNVTSIIFVNTVMHTALTQSMYDHYAFVPAFPGAIPITETIRKCRDKITAQDIVNLLPDKKQCLTQIATAYVLSGKNAHSHGKFGDDIVEKAFADKRIQQVIVEDFGERLQGVRTKINERNSKEEYSYDVLLPQNVPNGLAVDV